MPEERSGFKVGGGRRVISDHEVRGGVASFQW
jgi:hypothetical protein